MSTKASNLPLLLIPLHLFLVFFGTFFLSPEISFYPYLVSRGLTPYLNLIDQHFPFIFFGPLSLSTFHITSPLSSLLLFIFLLLVTDTVAFFYLKKNTKHPALLLGFFILAQLFLDGRTLWLETFVIFFLSLALYFSSQKPITSGLFFGAALATRPTLLPFFLLFILLKKQPLKTVIAASIFPLSQLLWLTQNQLWPQFLTLLHFNSAVYTSQALKLPTQNQLLALVLILAPLLFQSKKNLLKIILLVLTLAVPSYPRFELIHLLPLAILYLIYPPLLPVKLNRTAIAYALLLLAFFIFRRGLTPPHNFYYSSSNQPLVEYINNSSSKSLYILGGPDHLYQLTNTLPTNNLYIPSLPWYLSQPNLVEKQIGALKTNPSLVLVNYQATVDDQTLLNYARPLIDYITANYTLVATVSGSTIYNYRN